MERKLRNEENFEGNSVKAYHDSTGNYIVMSYATEIGRVTTNHGFKELNNRYFSSTTSRLQNLIISAWDLRLDVPSSKRFARSTN